ncbi:MAG TPA: IS1595 family transposase [Candidatus Avimonas sp.]|nr:IS1595 family transposase [Candidatus Avimonas sp.]HQD38807.1 IS1595 family transposase [Candidatus Avimonas sp.]
MEYPKKLMDFEKKFATDAQCREYLFQIRYPDGFHCPRCGFNKVWHTGRGKFQCQSCGKDTSVMAGTIFQGSHTPLTLWFRAIWYVVAQKHGTNALNLQRILGLGSYQTAWTMLHKLRRAMVRPGRDKLQGTVEVDEAFIGAPGKGGKRGRGAENKVLVAIAVEVSDNKIGRIRMNVIDDASSQSLHGFIESTVEKGSTIITDGWSGYSGLTSKGYPQENKVKKSEDEDSLLPHVHTTVSLLKRWLMGTLQGSCSREHFSYYLDEYTFRYNRRKSKSRGLLFLRLLENAVQIETTTYKQLINHGNN